MAFSSHRKNFKGKIKGITIEEISALDYTIQNLKERLEFLNDKYNNVSEFHNLYTLGDGDKHNYYKVAINKDDDLSSEINIFKITERDGSYLLNSKDIEKDLKQKYNFLDEAAFKKIVKYENNFSSIGSDSDVINFLDCFKKNDYINMEHKIYAKDLVDLDLINVLPHYQKAKDYLKNEMEKIKNKEHSEMNLYLIKKILKSINDDMINCKIALKGIRCPAKRLGDESGMFYSETIDYSNIEHIRHICTYVNFDMELHPDSDLSHIALDMRQALKKMLDLKIITNSEYEMIYMLNQGYKKTEIGVKLRISERMVRHNLDKTFKKMCIFLK